MFILDEAQLIAIIISLACSIVGVFLVLRRHAMMSDSIAHSVLIGIVVAYFFTHDLGSPYLLLGAAAAGLLTVWLTELVIKTRLVSGDAGIGIIFPLLFSLGVILIVKYGGNTHLCPQHIIEGEILFATGQPLSIMGYELGSSAIYTSLGILLLNMIVVGLFFKEFKIATFDPALAAALGLSPAIIHYLLMSLVSVTAVGSFQYVGSILVIAFMIAPPATAYLLTHHLRNMMLLSCAIALFNAVLGYQGSYMYNVSVSGGMAVMTGLSFFVVFLAAPHRGLISVLYRRHSRRIEFAMSTMLFHLINHESTANEGEEAGVATISEHLNWSPCFTQKIIKILCNKGKISIVGGVIKLTEEGRLQGAVDYIHCTQGSARSVQ